MKKVFLLFGIAAFSAASAQQNDVFDIQKHLEKKQAEFKKTNGQLKPFIPPFNTVKVYPPYTTNIPQVSFSFPNSDKGILLKQDKMPCVVPDMSLFQTMPNAGNTALIRREMWQIPNVASPFKTNLSR